MAPDQSGAVMLGVSPEDGVTIQPPIIQVRDSVRLTVAQSGDQAERILKTIAKRLKMEQVQNLGIKLVYHVALAHNDARGFVLNRLLAIPEGGLAELGDGPSILAGVKFILESPSSATSRSDGLYRWGSRQEGSASRPAIAG